MKFLPRTLYGRLSALILVLLIPVNLFYVALALEMSRVYREEVDQTLNRNIAANIVRDGWLKYGETVDKSTFDQAVASIGAVNPRIEIYLLDLSGNILSYSGPSQPINRKSVSLTPIFAFLQQSKDPPILGDDPRDLRERKIFSVAPIYNGATLAGYVYVVVGGQKYDSVSSMLRNSYVIRLGLGTMIGGLVIVIVVGLVSFNFFTGRLRRLAADVDSFRRIDDQTATSAIDKVNYRRDEIDQIAETFTKMSQRIDNQLHQLKLTDQSRRDFMASISHDLRTPLSALLGYIETILMKNNTISNKQLIGYLSLALKNGQTLHHLVDNLFEFSTLDTGEWPLRTEIISLADLVQDVCQKFELRARGAGIRFVVKTLHGAALVEGDVGLMERLLDNLIGNAIKFTPPGGSVNVNLTTAGRHVTVEIRDSGIGIDEAHLPSIFEPFFSATAVAKDANGSAGLGLAIASRIAELHGSSIQVESTPGAGSLFRFELTMVEHAEQLVTAL